MNVLVLTTSYPVEENRLSGIFVKELVGALGEIADVDIIIPASRINSENDHSNVHSFRYAPRSMQVLAHGAGGVPVAIKNNRFLVMLLPFFAASFFAKVLRLLGGRDVILANWAFCGFIGGLAKALYSIPLVTVLRGADVERKNTGFSKYLFLKSLKCSDIIVCVSDDMAKLLRQKYKKYSGKIKVINNGVDSSYFSNYKRIIRNDKCIRFCFVGSLIPRKNIEFILTEFSILKISGMDLGLDIVGSGTEEEKLKIRAKELKLESCINFHGPKPRSEIIKIMGRAHFYVSASESEGRPNSVAEAVANGLIPLLSNIPGHREFSTLCSEDILFNLSIKGSLSAKIKSFIDSSTYERIQAEMVSSRELFLHSWQVCASRYLDVFKMLRQE